MSHLINDAWFQIQVLHVDFLQDYDIGPLDAAGELYEDTGDLKLFFYSTNICRLTACQVLIW